ncbi:MAG: AsmA family protein, partial [Polyangiales bacterium]
MGKPLRITLIVTGLLLTLLVVGAVVVPLLFEDRIVQLLRTELNERLDAEVELADVDLSFLSTFPTFTAEVTELTVTGKGEFEGVQLLRASSVGAGLDLLALLFEDRIRITSVTVDQPDVHVIITKEGAANYDILGDLVAPPEDSEEAGDELAFEVERYSVNEGQIHYEEPGVDVLATSVNHDGRLRVAGAHEELSSKTRIEELSIRLGGIRYLKKAWVGVEIDGVLESERARLTLNAIKVMVNRLAIEGLGSIAWSGEGTEVDLTFASPEGLPIKALISAVPNAYAADFDGLQASGSFGLRGTVRGQLGPDDNDIPSFAVSARVRGGALKYPDLPLGLTDIELDATLDHPGGNLDKLKVNVPKYGLRAAKSHANGSLRLSRPLSGPDLVLALDGRFDLAEIAKAYPIPEVEGLAGLVEARVDLSAQGERVEKLAGSISARDVTYRTSDGQGVTVSEARVDLSPASTTIQALRAKVGTSDVSVRGVTSPLTTFLSDGQKITASL